MEKFFIKEIIEPLCIILIAVLIYILVSNVIKKLFKIRLKRIDSKKQQTMMTLIINIFRYVIMIIALLMILEVYGVDTKALVASLGVAGLVIGLAFQDLIKDLIAGISIVIEGYYDVGDTITVNGFRGKVLSLGMKTTKLKATNGDIKIITNGTVRDIINHSIDNSVAIVDVNISNDNNLKKTEEVLNKICQKLSSDLADLKGPVTLIGVNKFTDKNVIFRIKAETKPLKNFEIQREIQTIIKAELDKNNIKDSYPQLVIIDE